jgi:MoaA/NifB/PqqE/SkfB family radical SAM enzyme
MPDRLDVQEFELWKRLEGKRVPLSFDLELTARCNNDCRRC